MTNNIIPRFPTRLVALGFNPALLTDDEVGEGWRLLNEGDLIQTGDGFLHGEAWVCFECRADIFRGPGEYVHTIPWRRRV